MSFLSDIGNEIRIILVYSLLGTIPSVILIYFGWYSSTWAAAIEIILCCYLTICEDDVLLEAEPFQLGIRLIFTTMLYILTIYGHQEMKHGFGIKDPLAFNSGDTWSTWGLTLGLEHLRMANLISFYRICIFVVIIAIYILTYILSASTGEDSVL